MWNERYILGHSVSIVTALPDDRSRVPRFVRIRPAPRRRDRQGRHRLRHAFPRRPLRPLRFRGCCRSRAPPTRPPIPVPRRTRSPRRRARRTHKGCRRPRDLLVRKDYDAAIARLDQLAVERPREPQARFLKAVVLTDQKKTDAAVDDLSLAGGRLSGDAGAAQQPRGALRAARPARAGARRADAGDSKRAGLRGRAGESRRRLRCSSQPSSTSARSRIDKRNKSASAKLKLTREAAASAP